MSNVDRYIYIRDRVNCDEMVAMNLLNAIFEYAEENNNSTINWTLFNLLEKAFGSDLSEEDLMKLCREE